MTKLMADELVADDARYVMRPWSQPKGEPVPVVKAEDCVVTDAYGREYLDFTSGYFVNNAGHCHPRIIEAARQQLGEVLQVSGKHSTPAQIRLAKQLVHISPPSIDKVFFATGGSEANEFAFKMARQKTGKTEIAYLDNGYHGLTLGVLDACASEKYRATGGVPLGGHCYKIPTPYCYRCPHAQNCETQCLDEAEEALDAHPETAAVCAEPVQAVGGIIPPKTWWERLDEMRRARGLLLLLDEVQTGIGRTGAMFAAEHYGLEPDLLTAGKGLSGGVGSLAVAMASDEVCERFYAGTTPTSGGNAVSCAGGLALIEVVTGEDHVGNAARMGEYLTETIAALDDPWVGDIRFKGLLGGVELVLDRKTKQVPDKSHIVAVRDALHEDGMLITVSGPLGNCLRLQPPLTITAAQLDTFVEALGRALKAARAA